MKIMLPFILIRLYLVRHIINNNKDLRGCDTSIMPKYSNVFSEKLNFILRVFIFCFVL